MIRIVAENWGIARENGVTTFGVEALEVGGRYLLFSLSDEDGAQDRALGIDGLYLEVGSQTRGGYHAVLAVRAEPGARVVIELSPAGRELAGTESIVLDLSRCDGAALAEFRALMIKAGIPVYGNG